MGCAMARPARGAEVLDMAQEMILRARTIDELRQAQAVVLPLAYGLSLEQTARDRAIGGLDLSTAQPVSGWRDGRGRTAPASRRTETAEPEP